MSIAELIAGTRGEAPRLARALGVSAPLIWQWARGHRPLPTDRAPAIERATEGRVTCEQMRPDVRWVRVPDAEWPHPQGRPCIDVAGSSALVGAIEGADLQQQEAAA